MKDLAVQVKNVTMEFNFEKEKTGSLKEYIINKLKRKKFDVDNFRALDNISLDIKKGDSVGIIGSNGSGKSTLLKLIAGIFKPTKGEIYTNGLIAPMVELGAGFDSNLTARENIYLNGSVLGHDRNFMDDRIEQIIDFAELWDFIDVPIKNYSSGMQARLGFAVSTLIKPEILIVDEILSVGDTHFQEKCKCKMEELKSNGTTLILVSHSKQDVLENCNNAVWINKGVLMKKGNAAEIYDSYDKFMND